ncbi:MAG TPA: FAD-binding oxidoreductase, partial [Rhizomicrobium sp.]|nr:FAD-binding oxidoreductase [Rhizomicrobium sp.]
MSGSESVLEPVLARLKDSVGARGFSTDQTEIAPHLEEWRGKYHGHSPLLLKPASVAEISSILRICHESGTALVTQGGNTGLVGGQIPLHGEVLLSTQRLNRIRSVDESGMTLIAEAGVRLAQVQQAADDKHLLFPLSLASEGSCTIGGNISTNAGGLNVIAYGNTRDLVTGVEAVLADGSIVSALSKLRKDNTGYDVKSLFVGAEGTLGIVTAASLRLFPNPRAQATAFVGLKSPDDALKLLRIARERLG